MIVGTLTNDDWAESPGANIAEEVLVRKSFTLPTGTVVLSAQVIVGQDGTLLEVWFNNVNLFTGSVARNLAGTAYTVDPTTVIVGGGKNEIALHLSGISAVLTVGGQPQPVYAFRFVYTTP